MQRHELESRLRRRLAGDPLLRAARAAARDAGVALWAVGGWVRDAALGRRAGDLDLAAGPGAARLVRRLEASWGRRAFRFRKRGVTTWRFSIDSREVDVVDAGRRGIEADLLRREFTVNAIAFDLARSALLDPAGGLADLRSRRLRLPRADVVREDPVRALRAARFLAQLPGFRLGRDAARAARESARPLGRASAERVRDELDALLVAPDPARGLEALERLGLLGSVLPELLALRACPAGEGRPDAWRHTIEAIAISAGARRLPASAAAREPLARRVLRWSLLLHDMAKPATLRLEAGGRPTFHGHEVEGARAAAALLRRLRQPAALVRRVSRLVLLHLRPHHLADAGAPERGVRRLVRDAGEDLAILVLHAACDGLASGAPDGRRRWRRLRPVLGALLEHHAALAAAPLPRLIDGHDVMRALGLAPGPEVGRVLARVAELQVEGRIRDRSQALRHLASSRRAGGAARRGGGRRRSGRGRPAASR